MHRRYVVLAALLAFFGTVLYSAAALSCNAEGIGASKQPTVAAATVQHPAPVPNAQPEPAPKPEVAATAQPAGVTPGAATSNDDAGGNLGDGVGASSSTHKRGLRWQSFLPGVIK